MLGIRKFIDEREHDIHIYTFIICKIHNKTPNTLSRLPTQSVHLQMDIDNSLISPLYKISVGIFKWHIYESLSVMEKSFLWLP